MSELEQKLTDSLNAIENLERLSNELDKKEIKLVQFSMRELTYPVLKHKGTKYAVKKSNGNFTISLYDKGPLSVPPGQKHHIDFNSLLKQIIQMDDKATVEILIDTSKENDVREYINLEELFFNDEILIAKSVIFLPKISKFPPLKKIEIDYIKGPTKNVFQVDSPNIYRLKIMKLMNKESIDLSQGFSIASKDSYLLNANLEKNLKLHEFISTSDKIADLVNSTTFLTRIGLKTKPEKIRMEIIPPGLEINYKNNIDISYKRYGSTEELNIQFQKDKIKEVSKFIDGLKIESKDHVVSCR